MSGREVISAQIGYRFIDWRIPSADHDGGRQLSGRIALSTPGCRTLARLLGRAALEKREARGGSYRIVVH